MASRICARPGCGGPAVATLTYQYGSRTVWLDDLAPTPEPSSYDLCGVHAAKTGVPVGWACEDRRTIVSLQPRLAG